MNNSFYTSGLVLILGLFLVSFAFTQSKTDKPSIHASISDAPIPPGDVLAVDYIRQVCLEKTSPILTQPRADRQVSHDDYCDCQANWIANNIEPDDLHALALAYYDVNASITAKKIDKVSELDDLAMVGLRMMNYEKTYGISRDVINNNLLIYKKISTICY